MANAITRFEAIENARLERRLFKVNEREFKTMHASIKVELSEPVNSYGEMIESITIEPPNGADILQCGFPWSTETNPRTRAEAEIINVPAIRALLSRMARVPESTIDQLQAVDFFKATDAVKFFFQYETRKSSSNPSSPPADGQATSPSSGG